MKKEYQKPEAEIVDIQIVDSVMDVNRPYSDGIDDEDIGA